MVKDLVGTGHSSTPRRRITDKLADASGGQLTLTYRWARQDGGVCAQVPGFASLDMELDGAVTGTLS